MRVSSALATLAVAMTAPAAIAQPLDYPETRTVDVVEDQFGAAVADPYRWLENDVREDSDVADWVAVQNRVTDAYLETLPGRDELAASMTKLYDFEQLGVPQVAGDRLFYTRQSGDQNQPVLYWRDEVGEERVLLDPAGWSADGTVALADWNPSPDGARLAYSIQDGGSDWRTVKIVDVTSGVAVAEPIEWVKFSDLVWLPDGSGVVYSRFPKPEEGTAFQSLNKDQQIFVRYLEQVGQPGVDIPIFATPDTPDLGHTARLTSDGEWMVITSSSGTDERHQIRVIRMDAPEKEVLPIVTDFDNEWTLIDGVGDTLYFTTSLDAKRLRVMKTDVGSLVPPAGPRWTEVVPEHVATIEDAVIVGGRLMIEYIDDAKSRLEVHDLDGNPEGLVELPGLGTVAGLSGSATKEHAYFAFGSFNRPNAIFRASGAGEPDLWAEPTVPFDPAEVVVSQRFYASKDGTKIPLYLVHRRDADLSVGAPTLLYGYGGFNISVPPMYSPPKMAWVQAGGVYASANLRGGGEYGQDWHDAGRLTNKQNVFDDFIAAGEYLIAEGIAKPRGLAIEGRSNGGLLVGAVMNQRPDLFATGHAAVGVMDMLRFDRFTAGRYWVDDYGVPAKEADFRTLLAYSPYHNIADGTNYPPLIVSTADTDDRVVPGHSFKYIARMQALDTGDAPHVIRIETRAGHGSGKPTDKLIEEYADIYGFLGAHTGLFAQ